MRLEGLSNPAIAERLDLSIHTVRTHVEPILRTLDAHSKLEAVVIASRLGHVSSRGTATALGQGGTGAAAVPATVGRCTEMQTEAPLGPSIGPGRTGDDPSDRAVDLVRRTTGRRDPTARLPAPIRETGLAADPCGHELAAALADDQFRVVYQAQYRVGTGVLAGVEALARWEKDDGCLVPASEFIATAERTGAIVPLGAKVLETACTQAAAWNEQMPDASPIPVWVNLSPLQILDAGFLTVIRRCLDATGIAPDQLGFEVTETSLLADISRAGHVLNQVREMGVRLAIDDFGTGYASLLYLKHFRVHVLKLDRSFIADLTDDVVDRTIVGSTVDMAHRLGLEVVAEGIESGAQLDVAHRLGCDLAQGYFTGRSTSGASIGDLDRTNGAIATRVHGAPRRVTGP